MACPKSNVKTPSGRSGTEAWHIVNSCGLMKLKQTFADTAIKICLKCKLNAKKINSETGWWSLMHVNIHNGLPQVAQAEDLTMAVIVLWHNFICLNQ